MGALDELNSYKITNDEEIRQIKEAINAIHASLASLQDKIEANLRGTKIAINNIGDQLTHKFRWE